MLLSSGVDPDEALKGVPYAQAAVAATFGDFGITFITFALFAFAFTSIIGNLFYVESNLKFLNNKDLSNTKQILFKLTAVVVVFFGAQLDFSVAWDTADLLMGVMALINIPIIFILAKPAIRCLDDYTKQKKEGKNPVFKAKSIGIKEETDFWN